MRISFSVKVDLLEHYTHFVFFKFKDMSFLNLSHSRRIKLPRSLKYKSDFSLLLRGAIN